MLRGGEWAMVAAVDSVTGRGRDYCVDKLLSVPLLSVALSDHTVPPPMSDELPLRDRNIPLRYSL